MHLSKSLSEDKSFSIAINNSLINIAYNYDKKTLSVYTVDMKTDQIAKAT